MRTHVLALLVLVTGGSAFAQDPIVRLVVTPETVAVGESAQMQVTVLVPTWFAKPPVYPSFELANLATRLPPNSSYPTNERVAGETWSGIVRNYRVYPLMSANFQLGGQSIRVNVANPGSEPTVVDVTVPDAVLSATVPQGAEAVQPYIAGRSLMLSREIDGNLDGLEIGDAIVIRTVAELDGLPAMFLPPLSPELALEGVTIYADEPVIEDGDIARRTEKVTLVLESGGDFVFPAIELDWWDMLSNSVATATVPEISFSVAGPAASLAVPAATVEPNPLGNVPLIAGLLAALVITWRVVRRLLVRSKQKVAAKRQTEQYAFSRFAKACNGSDAKQVYHTMLEWLARIDTHLDARSFAVQYGEDDLGRQIEALSVGLYGDSDNRANLGHIGRALARARQRFLASASASSGVALPPLNP